MPLYIAKSGDLDRCYRCLTDRLTTLKDSATQLLIKYKSGALVTQYLVIIVIRAVQGAYRESLAVGDKISDPCGWTASFDLGFCMKVSVGTVILCTSTISGGLVFCGHKYSDKSRRCILCKRPQIM